MRGPIFLFFILFCLAACKNADKADYQQQQVAVASQPADYYKRFSGIIAGQPVVLNLQRNTRAYSVMSGSYYYVKQGRPIGLYILPDSAVANGFTVDEDPERKGDTIQPRWKIVYAGNTITGKWTSADGKKTFDIDLEEDYPMGSYKPDIWTKVDSIPYHKGRALPVATVSYALLRTGKTMNADDAAFYEQTLFHELGFDTINYTSLDAAVQTQIDSYTTDYKRILHEVDDSLLGEAFNNYYAGYGMSVIYNDSGLLVLQLLRSDYSGGAHGNYEFSYINIDMQGRRVWRLDDIMKVDTAKLQGLLEQQARKTFGIPAGESIKDHMLTDRVLPTPNCYITNTGIALVYNPYEIAAYAYGVSTFFIPYTQIRPLLKPEFVQRMKLQ